MGFLNFLKLKKGSKGTEHLAPAFHSAQLPPLPTDRELYSELPNLPEAPETSGLSEIELPEPLKGFESFDLAGTGEEGGLGKENGFGDAGEASKKKAESSRETPAPSPLLPNWPQPGKPLGKQFAEKLPEIPQTPEIKLEESPQAETESPNIPSEVPEIKPFEPRQKGESRFSGGLISYGGTQYLSAYDFRVVMDSFANIIKTQKKHHNLTEIKKEEHQHYEQINVLFEDLQRKLMLIDRTLFE